MSFRRHRSSRHRYLGDEEEDEIQSIQNNIVVHKGSNMKEEAKKHSVTEKTDKESSIITVSSSYNYELQEQREHTKDSDKKKREDEENIQKMTLYQKNLTTRRLSGRIRNDYENSIKLKDGNSSSFVLPSSSSSEESIRTNNKNTPTPQRRVKKRRRVLRRRSPPDIQWKKDTNKSEYQPNKNHEAHDYMRSEMQNRFENCLTERKDKEEEKPISIITKKEEEERDSENDMDVLLSSCISKIFSSKQKPKRQSMKEKKN